MIAVKHHRLTEYVNRPFVLRCIRAARPEVFHSMIVLAIKLVVVRHVISLRDRMRSILLWQSPTVPDIKDKSAKT